MAAFTDYPYEQQQALIAEAVEDRYGKAAVVLATYPDHVVFTINDDVYVPDGEGAPSTDPDGDGDDDSDDTFDVPFTVNAGGDVVFGQAKEVVVEPPVWTAVNDGDEGQQGFPGGNGLSDRLPNLVLSDETDPSWYEQVDASHTVALRLADTAAAVPLWQPFHVIGKWSVPHGVSGKIQFTRDMGDSIIRNFNANVLRRRVPMDERHLTEQNGIALAWAEQFRWGEEGEGLPGAPEPSGHGPILYTKWDYNQLGSQRLSDRHYLYFSPQYSLDYVDKQTGTHYGPTALACAGTNDPFIRNMRDAQGNPAMPWVDPGQIAASDFVVITDGLRPYHTPQEDVMPNQPGANAQPGARAVPVAAPAQQPAAPQLADVALSDEVRRLREELNAEKAARAQNDVQLAEERKRSFRKDVDAFYDSLTRRGVPPGATTKLRNLTKRLIPSDKAVVSLSDDPDAAPDMSLADAIMACAEDITAIDLRSRTWPSDVRPKDQVELEEQIEKAQDEFASAKVQEMYADRIKAG